MLLSMTGFAVCVLPGCDGKGLFLGSKGSASTDGDDIADDDDSDNTDDIDNNDTALGTWITSYGDDRVTSAAARGAHQSAARIVLRRNGSDVSGTGTVFRMFGEGTVASDTLAITVDGTLTGQDAVLTVTKATGGTVSDQPEWKVRFSGSQMMGIYASYNSSDAIVRAGHAFWTKLTSTSLNGSWISGFSDAGSTTGYATRDRTGVMVIDTSGSTVDFTGTGTLIEQRNGGAPLALAFNLTNPDLTSTQVQFSMEELDLDTTPIDWAGFESTTRVVGAYSQFDSADSLMRLGHASWYYCDAAVTPDIVDYTWATAFSDTTAATNNDSSSFLMTVKLSPGDDDAVTGSGSYFDINGGTDAYRALKVSNGTMVGNYLQMDLYSPSSGETFSWDIRVTDGRMVGTYQRFDGFDNFLSRGSAEWRTESTSTPSLEGSWSSSFVDHYTTSTKMSYLSLVTVTDQSGTALSGLGSLRLANAETGRRLFDLVDSTISSRDITWVWNGVDLYGDTIWRLRLAGTVLFGVYENQTSSGDIESQGSAFWIRTPLDSDP